MKSLLNPTYKATNELLSQVPCHNKGRLVLPVRDYPPLQEEKERNGNGLPKQTVQ